MSDFRNRFGRQLGAASRRLFSGAAEADFRSRFASQLTQASAELARARDAVAPAGDFRARLGLALTEAAAGLAAQRVPARGLSPRVARTGRRDFRARFGLALAAAARELAHERETRAGSARRTRVRLPRLTAPSLALMPRLTRAQLALMPRLTRSRIALMRRLTRPVAIAIALTALAGAATAEPLWLVQVGNPNYGETSPGLSSTAPPPAQLGALAVLRRSQTDADRVTGVQAALEDVNQFTSGVRTGYVRVLATTPGGPVVLIPVVKRDASAGGSGSPAAAAIADALCLYYPSQGGSSGLNATTHCWSTQDLLEAKAFAERDGHVFGLVPDGYSSVTIAGAGGPPVTAPVTNNFFDAQVGASTAPGPAPSLPVTSGLTITFSN